MLFKQFTITTDDRQYDNSELAAHSTQRRSMDPSSVEAILMLRNNRDLRAIYSIDRIVVDDAVNNDVFGLSLSAVPLPFNNTEDAPACRENQDDRVFSSSRWVGR